MNHDKITHAITGVIYSYLENGTKKKRVFLHSSCINPCLSQRQLIWLLMKTDHYCIPFLVDFVGHQRPLFLLSSYMSLFGWLTDWLLLALGQWIYYAFSPYFRCNTRGVIAAFQQFFRECEQKVSFLKCIRHLDVRVGRRFRSVVRN